MRAFVLREYGGPDKASLRNRTMPSPGNGDLLIEVEAMGLNPVDYKTRQGKLKQIYKLKFPVILGNELSGVVLARGGDVKDFKVGDHVIARVDKAKMGAFAEMATVDATLVALAPDGVPLEDVAALPLAGLTAMQALRGELDAGPGKHILITGGAGGVGTFAIQLAKHLGATVTTTASPRGEALVLRMGADHVIDYTTTDLSTVEASFDGVFDLIGGETLEKVMALAKPGSTVVSVAGIPEPVTATKDLKKGVLLRSMFWFASMGLRRLASKHDVTYRYLFMHPSGPELAELSELVGAGKLEIVIDRRFPFSEIAKAIEFLEDGRAKGKVVVEVD